MSATTKDLKIHIKILDGFTAGLEGFQKKLGEGVRSLDKLENKIKVVSKLTTNIGKSLTLGITAPLIGLGTLAIKEAMEAETAYTSFTSLFSEGETSAQKATEKAKKMMGVLRDLAKNYHMDFAKAVTGTSVLAASGVKDISQMAEKLKVLGNVAAGTGNKVGVDELAANLGYVRKVGIAQSDSILQLANRGIPIVRALKEIMKLKDTSEVFKLASTRKISAKTYEGTLTKLQSKGDVYFDQMNKQSKTLAGSLQILASTKKILFQDIGKELQKVFNITGWIQKITKLVDGFITKLEKLRKNSPKLLTHLIKFGAVLAGIGPALLVVGMGINVCSKAFGGLGTAVSAVIKIVGLLTSPVLLLVATIATLVGAFIYSKNKSKNLQDVLKDLEETFGKISKKVEEVADKIGPFFGGVKEGTASAFNKLEKFFKFIEDSLGDFPEYLGDSFIELFGSIKELGQAFMGLFKELGKGKGLQIDWKQMILVPLYAIVGIVALVIKTFTFLAKALTICFNLLKSFIQSMDKLKETLSLGFAQGVSTIKNLWGSLMEKLGKGWQAIKALFVSMGEWIKYPFVKAIEFVLGLWNKFIGVFKKGAEFIGNLFKGISNFFSGIIGNPIEVSVPKNLPNIEIGTKLSEDIPNIGISSKLFESIPNMVEVKAKLPENFPNMEVSPKLLESFPKIEVPSSLPSPVQDLSSLIPNVQAANRSPSIPAQGFATIEVQSAGGSSAKVLSSKNLNIKTLQFNQGFLGA